MIFGSNLNSGRKKVLLMLRFRRLMDALKSIRYRTQCWMYEKVFGESVHMVGCYELRIFSGDESGYISFYHCTEIEFESDNMVWFKCLDHENAKFTWPDKEPLESPISYINRLHGLKGVEQVVQCFQHYEALVMRGYFKYENPTHKILEYHPTRAHLPQDNSLNSPIADRKFGVIEGKKPS